MADSDDEKRRRLLHQARRLQLTAQIADRAFQRSIIDRGKGEQRLHRADGGIDLAAG